MSANDYKANRGADRVGRVGRRGSKKPSLRSHSIELDVQFHDCDPMNIVWHGHYVKYFEVARCALLDSFGYGYQAMFDSGFAWPIVDMQLRYVRPARFGQTLRIQADLLEWEYRLKIAYVITDAATGERLTKGETSQVAVDMSNDDMCMGSPMIVAEKLGLQPEAG